MKGRMLTVEHLSVRIAAASILEDVALEVRPASLTALMGRNGAGKTTFMRSVMGLIPVRSGEIRFDGADLARLPAHRRAGLGIGYMPEDRRLVPELTVRENTMVPAWAAKLDDAEPRLERIYALMPEVEEFAGRRAMQLSGGQQKLAALARALMAGTRLVLLDEPFEGLAPALAGRLVEVLSGLKEQGLSVLLSESDSTHSEHLVDDLYVIERGRVRKIEAKGAAGHA
jgi:branched-chain amino acid transport system ATP-binding protein